MYILPENASQHISWTSSDPQIATVDSDGLIRAKGLGEATITATAKNGMTATSTIKVIPYFVKSIYLSSNYKKIAIGETMQINSSIYPDKVEDKTLNWTSSNPEILTIDQNGLVTGVGVGTVQVTATSENGVTSELTIEVLSEILVTDLTLNKTEIEVLKNKTYTLSCKFTPTNATNKNVYWESLNPEVATIDNNGTIYGVKQGTTQIKVTHPNGYYAYCTVTVKEVPLKSVFIKNYSDFYDLKIGDTVKIEFNFLPTNTTFDRSSLTYKSGDTEIAIVDQNGYVTITGNGVTNIFIYVEEKVVCTLLLSIYSNL